MLKLRLKNIFAAGKNDVIGLDIGSSALKYVNIKFEGNLAKLYASGIEEEMQAPAQALKNFAQSRPTGLVNTAVSGSSVIIRCVDFPQMHDDEIRKALKFEAQKHIPFAVDEVSLDSYSLKQYAQENKILVLLAAVKKDFLIQRTELLKQAGLRANLVDVDSLCLVNAFNYNYDLLETGLKNKTIALLNIGATYSNLNILEGGMPFLSRDIPIAGNNFTRKIADSLSIDLKQAETLKKNPDKDSLEKLLKAFESVLSGLVSELRTSFDYYESQHASSVVKLFLSGGSLQFAGLKDILANLTGLETEIWDPLRKVVISDNLDKEELKSAALRLGVAIGLALRR